MYFEDGSSKVLGGKASTAENLKYDFDGLLSWDEYDKISAKELSAKEVADLAKKLYNAKNNNKIIRVEIVNILTNEVVVSSN